MKPPAALGKGGQCYRPTEPYGRAQAYLIAQPGRSMLRPELGMQACLQACLLGKTGSGGSSKQNAASGIGGQHRGFFVGKPAEIRSPNRRQAQRLF